MSSFPRDPLPAATRALIALARLWPVTRGRNRLRTLVASTLRQRKPYVPARLAHSGLTITVPWDDSVGGVLLTFGDNDPDLFRFLSVCLAHADSARDLFIDVGANCGAFSLRVAERFPHSRVISFEPNPEVAALFRHNAEGTRLADRIDLREVALGEVELTTQLSVAPGDSGGGTLREADGSGIPVALRRLSTELSAAQWQRVAAIKVDVEGYELGVFRGAAELFRAHLPPLVFEVNRVELAARGIPERALGDFLREVGYRDFYALDRRLYPIQNGMYEVSNVAAFGPDSREIVEAYGFDAAFRPKPQQQWPVVHFDI